MPVGELEVSLQQFERRARMVVSLVGITEPLKRLWRPGLAQLIVVQVRRRCGEVLIGAAMVEVQMRIDQDADVPRRIPALRELRRDRLICRLLGQFERQNGVDEIEVISAVEHEQPVWVLDQDAVDGEPHRRSAPDVPGDVRLIDDERAAVEQSYLCRL